MIKTFDWLRDANRDKEWLKTVEDALMCDKQQVIFHEEMYKLTFDPLEHLVTVQPFSEDSIFRSKIIPLKLTFDLVNEVIHGNWDAFSENNVFYVPER